MKFTGNSFTKQISLFIILLLLASCHTQYAIEKKETRQYTFSDSAQSPVDSAIWKLISPYHNELSAKMSEVLAFSEQALVKDNPEGLLGDFAADAVQHQAIKKCEATNMAKPDFTFLNNGSLRVPLPKGDITLGNIFELMPFENAIVILEIKGKDLDPLFKYIGDKNGIPVSGIRMNIKNKAVESVFVNGVALEAEKTYRVATNDYLANGGDNMSFLKSALTNTAINYTVRDAFINELKEIKAAGKTLKVNLDGRITKL